MRIACAASLLRGYSPWHDSHEQHLAHTRLRVRSPTTSHGCNARALPHAQFGTYHAFTQVSELTGNVRLQTLAGEIYTFDWSQTCSAASVILDSDGGDPAKHAAQAALLLADLKSTASGDTCGGKIVDLRPIVDANSQIKCYTPDVGFHGCACACARALICMYTISPTTVSFSAFCSALTLDCNARTPTSHYG
jgi:hypothetical protein